MYYKTDVFLFCTDGWIIYRGEYRKLNLGDTAEWISFCKRFELKPLNEEETRKCKLELL